MCRLPYLPHALAPVPTLNARSSFLRPTTTHPSTSREPNLLRYPPAQVQRKLSRLAATLKLSPPTAAALVGIHPYLLLSAPGHLSARVQDLGLVLSIPPGARPPTPLLLQHMAVALWRDGTRK